MSLAFFPTEIVRYCFSFLDAFTLAKCSSVNKEWYSIIEEHGKDLWHYLALGYFPVILITNDAEENSSIPTPVSAKSPFSINWMGFSKQERDFGSNWSTKQWKLFAKQVAFFCKHYSSALHAPNFSTKVVEERHKIRDDIVKDLMVWGIDASTTDKPNQSVHNAISLGRGGFWSSEPNPKADSIDWTLYLIRKSCYPRALLITSVTIKSMIAYWQENRIYAPKQIQIHLYLNSNHPNAELLRKMKREKKPFEEPQPMYSSPIFDYDSKSGAHQVFPVGPILILTQHPNDRIYIKIDFIGKTAQHYDDLYYTCIDRIFVHGKRFCYDETNSMEEPLEQKAQFDIILKEAQDLIRNRDKNQTDSIPRITSEDKPGLKWFQYNGMSERKVHWSDGLLDEEVDDVYDETAEDDEEMVEEEEDDEDDEDGDDEDMDSTTRRPAFRNQATSLLQAYLQLLGVRMRIIPQQMDTADEAEAEEEDEGDIDNAEEEN